jgi:hypothetical protein
MAKAFHYGGQALIEGVMMRGQNNLTMAMRRPNGELLLITKPLAPLYTSRVRKAHLLRGIIVLIETLVFGIQSLLYSANVSLEEEKQQISGATTWLMLAFSLAFTVGLFFIAPLFLSRLFSAYIATAWLINIIEGLIRIGIFIVYLGAINLVPDIKRVFAYHGAEHKAVNAYEDGTSLETAAVKKYSTAHLRCGTNFLLIILVVAILIFAFLSFSQLWLVVLSRIVLIPVIAAIGYEITQLGARNADNPIVHALLRPGLLLQVLTTREPDDSQLEASICALKAAVDADLNGLMSAMPLESPSRSGDSVE